MVRAHRVPLARTILLKCTVFKYFPKVEIRLQEIEGSQGGSYPFNGRILLVIPFPHDMATVTALDSQGFWAFNDSICEALFSVCGE